ncbi:hypothetical protein Tco_0908596 [Tanacetum coccineum]|uniref:Uncharacterized protein n=1 Tax=Tanacetum coccineum TaxID=301880 RepID=A0ABQ5CR30_9ASTR
MAANQAIDYPQSAPAYKEICKFFMNCPLAEAVTRTPSVIYQNFLRKFWCIAIAYDPNPPADDSVDPSKVTPIELMASMISVNNRGTLVSQLPFSIKKKKGKSQIVTPTLPKSQGPEASGALSRKRNKPKSKKTTPKVQVTPPTVPTEDSEKTQSVSSVKTVIPQDTERTTQLAIKGSHSPLDEGTRKSQPLPEGPHRDKDSEGLNLPADMEPSTNLVLTLLGTDAKYQVDQTQSTRLRYWSLTKNKGETSSEVKSDTKTLLLTTDADVQALLLSDDDLAESEDDEFEAEIPTKERVSEEHQSPTPHKEQPESSHAKDTDAFDSESSSCLETFRPYDNFVPVTKRVLVQNLQHILEVLYAQVAEDNWTKHEEDGASYADLKDFIEEYYKENVDHRAQTDKHFQETMTSHNKISKAGVDERAKLLKSLNRVSETLKADSALKEEMKKMAESNTTISGNITNLIELLKNAKLPEVITKLDAFHSTLNTLST